MASATLTSTPAQASPVAPGPRLQALGFGGLVAVLVWALGSNRPWAVALLAALVWASVVLAAVGAVWRAPVQARARTQAQPALVPAAWLPLGALLGFAGLVVLQQLPGLGANGGTLSIDPSTPAATCSSPCCTWAPGCWCC